MAETSTKPYLLRALYDWCTDNGYTPFVAVSVNEHTQVPREYVRNDEIVLNVSAVATSRLKISNEELEFVARFAGVAREVRVPIENISAIYARETGHGMAFEVTKDVLQPLSTVDVEGSIDANLERQLSEIEQDRQDGPNNPDGGSPNSGGRPRLVRVK